MMNLAPTYRKHVVVSLIGILSAGLLLGICSASGGPDPISLLQGVESARLQIPASTLRLRSTYRDSLVTNETEMLVDFDRDLRGFTYTLGEPYRTVFDGSRVITYDETIHQVELRNPNDQNQMRLFDPRVLGLSTYHHWEDTIENTLAYRNAARVELIGKEEADGRPAWHVRLTIVQPHGSWPIDYWIDDTKGFRVYRKEYNGMRTTSHYENASYPWLPSLIIGKEYSGASNDVLQSQREWRILDAKADLKFSKSRWTLEGMGIKPGAAVVDLNLRRRIGHWTGKQLALEPDGPSQKPSAWTYWVLAALLAAPMILFWRSRRRASQSVIT